MGHSLEFNQPLSPNPNPNLERQMKTESLFESFHCRKDDKARRVLNVAPDAVANVSAETLEKGVSLESLAAIGVPVFCYQTQITIHGKLPDFNPDARVQGYKAIFRNANGSIGVRYAAIDGAKKALICRAIEAKRGRWSASMRSDGLTLTATFRQDEKEKAIAFANESKPLAALVYGSLYGMTLAWGAGFMVCLYVGAIPQESLWDFIGRVSGLTSEAEIAAFEAQREAERAAKRAQWEAEAEAAAKEREAAMAAKIAALAPFRLTVEPAEPGARFRLLNRMGELVTIELSGTARRMFYSIDGGKRREYRKGWPVSLAEGRIFAAIN